MRSLFSVALVLALPATVWASQGHSASGPANGLSAPVPDAQGILDLGPFDRGVLVHFTRDGRTIEPVDDWRELALRSSIGLPHGEHLTATDSNASGGLVGWLGASADEDARASLDPACRSHTLPHTQPFVWDGAELVEIDLPSTTSGRALGMNEGGDCVGTLETRDGALHAFLWWRGALLDLPSYCAADSEWQLLAAHDVNDDGVVVGVGLRGGAPHLFALHLGTFLPSGGGPLYPPGGGPWVGSGVALGPVAGSVVPSLSTALSVPCIEYGAEAGDFGSWTCFRQPFGGAWAPMDCATSGNAVVVAGAAEPNCLPLAVTSPRGGSFGIRVGDTVLGGNGHAIETTFTPTVKRPNFDFDYALVLQICPNQPAAQPRFVVEARVGSGTIYSVTRTADCSSPYFDCTQTSCTNQPTNIRNWSCWSIPLGAYIGQPVTIRLEADDCTKSGHYGYAYVDIPCNKSEVVLSAPTELCEGDPLIVDGTQNLWVPDHFWSIHECDANWNPVSAEVMSWFPGPADVFDFTAFAAANGLTLKCGYNYRVKLALPSECFGWIETTKHVTVICPPPAFAGPDRDTCFAVGGTPTAVTIGDPNAPTTGACDFTFTWTDEQGQVVGTTKTISVAPQSTTTYTLTVTDPCTGCKAQDTMTVFVLRDDAQVTITPTYFCLDTIPKQMSTWLTASVPGYGGYLATYSWSPGGAGATILAEPAVETTYTVTVTHPGGCVTLVASILVPAGGVGPLAIPNAFSPNGDGVNDTWNVIQVGMGLGEKPAYNSRAYRLWIFNGWGQQVRYIEKTAAVDDALANGEIEWDGRDDNGVMVILNDLYVYRLELLDCEDAWSPPVIGHIIVLS